MAILNFKEIPPANSATGEQDEFELFSRDFLEFAGYKIISEPDRGQDGGIDILVEEIRSGVGGDTFIRWLVSCKHYAHSNSGKGKSVGVDDEINVGDRVDANNSDGFIGFYSTIASSGLTRKLEGWANRKSKEFQIFHRGKIEQFLFAQKEGIVLAKRYFPHSMQKWQEDSVDDTVENIRQKYYEDYIRRKRHD